MKICPKCSETYLTANYCTQDGTYLENVQSCTCGAELLRSYKFCAVCGAPRPTKEAAHA
jgi:hypothetical protein